MASRGPLALEVTFGPSRSRRLEAALARARRGRVELEELEPGRWRARFHLDRDRAAFGKAWALVSEVGWLGATELDVDGSPESARDVGFMAECARRWLRAREGCEQIFWQSEPFDRCHVCPLYDPDRLEVRPPHPPSPAMQIDIAGALGLGEEIPDFPPEDWE